MYTLKTTNYLRRILFGLFLFPASCFGRTQVIGQELPLKLRLRTCSDKIDMWLLIMTLWIHEVT